MQTHKPRLLLIFGVVVLMATVRGGQPGSSTELGPSGEALKPTANEMPEQHLNQTVESFAPAVERVAPAVVRIVTASRPDNPADLAGNVPNPQQHYLLRQALGEHSPRALQAGLGSGVIVTEDGYILTNGHLIAGASELEVTLQDGREFKASVIGLDALTDVAVIKVDTRHLPTVPLADSRCVRVGDVVLAIGYPFGVGQTVTHGIVSATDRGGMGIEGYESFIQTDAPINPGNSGGALVDIHGALIGINTAILSNSGGNLGIGFAIPSDLARRVMADLLMYGYVVRGYLGVETQNLTPGLAKAFKVRGAAGVLVGEVVHNGPAEQAGIQVGDVITRFDGKPVQDSRQLKLSVAEAKPGQSFPIEVLRDGSARLLRVTIRNASNVDLLTRTGVTLYEQNPGELQGVFIGELNRELRQKLKIPCKVHGAFVFDLHASSTAAQAGLRPGDVIESINQRDIRNGFEVSQVVQAAKDKRILLRVWSTAGTHFILIED